MLCQLSYAGVRANRAPKIGATGLPIKAVSARVCKLHGCKPGRDTAMRAGAGIVRPESFADVVTQR